MISGQGTRNSKNLQNKPQVLDKLIRFHLHLQATPKSPEKFSRGHWKRAQCPFTAYKKARPVAQKSCVYPCESTVDCVLTHVDSALGTSETLTADGHTKTRWIERLVLNNVCPQEECQDTVFSCLQLTHFPNRTWETVSTIPATNVFTS